MKSINWDKQPTPEHVWLELGYAYGDCGWWAVKSGDEYVMGKIKIHEKSSDILSVHNKLDTKECKPETEPYKPEVGEWCECYYPIAWSEVYYIGENSTGAAVIELKTGECFPIGGLVQFRPIKSERDQFIERAKTLFKGDNMELYVVIAATIYDNGARFTDENS